MVTALDLDAIRAYAKAHRWDDAPASTLAAHVDQLADALEVQVGQTLVANATATQMAKELGEAIAVIVTLTTPAAPDTVAAADPS